MQYAQTDCSIKVYSLVDIIINNTEGMFYILEYAGVEILISRGQTAFVRINKNGKSGLAMRDYGNRDGNLSLRLQP